MQPKPEAVEVRIRPEAPTDAAAIRRLHDAAFGGPIEGRIVDDLRGSDGWLADGSLVAEDADGSVVGHLLLSRGSLAGRDGTERAVGIIGPVGVMPARQGTGIGSALMWRAIEVATSLGFPLACLLGHADYYPRFGFEPARGMGIEAPHPWPDANWLALRLPGWNPGLRGRVQFPAAFPD